MTCGLGYRRAMDGRRERAPVSEAEFLAWAESRDERFELCEGEIVMQAGASRDHERVAKALLATLYAQIHTDRYDVNKGDLGVRVGIDGWPSDPTVVRDAAASIELPEIGARIALADVYRKPREP